MKIIDKILTCITVVCVLLAATACSDENIASRTPVAALQYGVEDTHLNVNESMVLHFTGVADLVAIYTGDVGHRYEYRDSMETGMAVNKGLFTYSYSAPGRFHVVCVASTFDTYEGHNAKTDTCSFYVTVTDDVTDLSQVYTSITPNTYYASQISDGSWVLRLPTKQIYNNREINLNAKRQRINYVIASDSSKVFIDNVAYSNRTRYDLSKNHLLTVRSYTGNVRNYNLYCLIYPEFLSVTVNGVKGVQTRDAYDQSKLTYTFNLPNGTDLSNAAIEYKIDGDGIFQIDGKVVDSGSMADLQSSPCAIVRKAAANGEAQAITNIKLVFNFQ